jgi:iron complex transport system permease protein
MKVTLDLTKLLEEGKITSEERDRLYQLGAAATGSLAFNILLGFGVVAVSAGLIALVPNATTGIVIGLAALGAGLGLYAARLYQWEVLAHICVLIGALALAGGVVVLTDASVWGFLGIAAGFTLAGIVARSGLLVVLAVLALSSSLGARTDYEHATYFLGIGEPTLTIVVFSVLALAAYLVSKVVPSAFERLALQAARASILLVNLGFWIGSLWGDASERLRFHADETVYVVLWALALLAVGLWAARENRRWVVNIAAIFLAVHFYTQWFERLGANPVSVLLAGLLALAFAVGLWHFNRTLFDSGRSPPAGLPVRS